MKKTYDTPSLKVFGSLIELTKGIGIGGEILIFTPLF